MSLTFDDGDPSQLEKAIPSMDKHGLRGTFFLSPPNVQTPQAIAAWQAATAGKWVVLAFHTIEGHRLSVAGEDFEMLLNHLARNRSRIWTDTFGAIAAKVAATQKICQRAKEPWWSSCRPWRLPAALLRLPPVTTI